MSLFVQIQHEFFGELDKQQKCTDPVVPDSQRLWSKNDITLLFIHMYKHTHSNIKFILCFLFAASVTSFQNVWSKLEKIQNTTKASNKTYWLLVPIS